MSTDTYMLNNRYNYNPEKWGPKGWYFLDTIILSYPENPTEKQKEDFINFFSLVGYMLPCYKCRINYNKHLEANPLTVDTLQNRESMIKWWLGIHNMSRVSIGKDSYSINDFNNFYTNDFKTNDNNNIENTKNVVYVCIFLILVLWFKDYLFKIKS